VKNKDNDKLNRSQTNFNKNTVNFSKGKKNETPLHTPINNLK
jgi:hypothetical protein